MNSFVFVFFLVLSIVSTSYSKEVDNKYYSVRDVKFFDNGFPKSLVIRLFGHSINEFYPSQTVIISERDSKNQLSFRILSEGIKVEPIEDDKEMILDVTLDMKSCQDMDFFNLENPRKWKFTKIEGPRMLLPNNVEFLPIIFSSNCRIGLTLAPIRDEEFLEAWKREQGEIEK